MYMQLAIIAILHLLVEKFKYDTSHPCFESKWHKTKCYSIFLTAYNIKL